MNSSITVGNDSQVMDETKLPESYEQDAKNYAETIATKKTEELRLSVYNMAIAATKDSYMKEVLLKASELTDSQVREIHKEKCTFTDADYRHSFFYNEHYRLYPNNIKSMWQEYYPLIINGANELINGNQSKLDDYYATSFTDAFSYFENEFNSADFTLTPYSDWLLIFSSEYDSANSLAEVVCG